MLNRKSCTKCGITKSFSEFSKSKTASDGLTSQCKQCRNLAKKAWNAANKDHVAKYNKQYSQKHEDKNKDWKQKNRERINELERIRYHANKDNFLAKNRANYQKHANKRRAYQANRKKDLPWLNAFHRATEKAKALGLVPVWADVDAMKAVYRRKHEMEKAMGIQLHVDHIVPLKCSVVSGLHCEANLQILTASGNARKNNHFCQDV